MPRTAEPMARIPDRLPVELLRRVEAWRTAQAPPPSLTRTLAYLIEIGLAAAAAKQEPGKDTSD